MADPKVLHVVSKTLIEPQTKKKAENNGNQYDSSIIN